MPSPLPERLWRKDLPIGVHHPSHCSRYPSIATHPYSIILLYKSPTNLHLQAGLGKTFRTLLLGQGHVFLSPRGKRPGMGLVPKILSQSYAARSAQDQWLGGLAKILCRSYDVPLVLMILVLVLGVSLRKQEMGLDILGIVLWL